VGAGVDVLLKVHQLVYRWGADDPELADVLVPNDVNTNELLAAVDVLVTDYSSIFFDFLAEDRPIVFYVPDRAQYEDGRGLYYPIDSLPGELSDDPESLADAVRRAVRDGEGEEVVRRRADWTATHAPFADASITGRVIDAVFRKQTAGVGLVSLLSPERARILVRVGRVNDADVLREVLDAVEDADPVRNDVTVSFSNSTTQSNAEMVRTLEQSCRLLPVAGTMVATADERKLYSRARQAFGAQDSRDGGLSDDEREILDRVASREWTRSFGEVVFDRVIDLTGDPLPSGIARAPFRGASTEATA
jgi:hypothetical protein